MFRATDSGGCWVIETDEAGPLAFLRGLPDSGSGHPWSTARNGAAKGGNTNRDTMLVAVGFDKQTATMFAVDPEAHGRALKLSTALATAEPQHRERARRF
jgi:hypothetical protein